MDDNKKEFIIIAMVFVVLISTILFVSYNDDKEPIDNQNSPKEEVKEEIENNEEIEEDITGDITYDLEDYNINKSGNYDLEGNYGCIKINTKGDVTLNLKNAIIACSGGPGINSLSNNKVLINLFDNNKIYASTIEEYDGAIYSSDNLVFNGSGSLTINSNIDGIVSKKKIIFNGGTYNIISTDDGIRGKDSIEFNDSNVTIKSVGDGIKSSTKNSSTKGYIIINSGTFKIHSDGDAFSASNYIKVNDGNFDIKTLNGNERRTLTSAKGIKADKSIIINNGIMNFDTGDDSIHSKGTLTINGGNIIIQSADDAIHAEKTLEINNGELTITKCYEGIESQMVTIKGGNIDINAFDDGINAVHPTLGERDSSGSGKVLIKGGKLKIKASADGIDSNGIIQLDNGEVFVESYSGASETALDHDGELIVNGGTLISVSRLEGADPHGEMKSKIPMLAAYVRGTSKTITLGNISVETGLSNYSLFIIASDKLEIGDNILKYDEKDRTIRLFNGVFIYANPNYRRK